MYLQRWLCLCLLGVAVPLQAGEMPRKYVDEKGHVTYSDQPVPGAVREEVVPVDPEPSPEAVEAARKRAQETEKLAEEARKAREKREKEREAARKAEARSKPNVVVIQKEESGGYYPVYRNPPLIRPEKPVRPGQPDHPAYRPPGSRPPANRPPTARPPVSIQPVPAPQPR